MLSRGLHQSQAAQLVIAQKTGYFFVQWCEMWQRALRATYDRTKLRP